jgi:hypothetical protein
MRWVVVVAWSGIKWLRGLNLPQKDKAKKVFERMWVAGTLGAFFAAFVRTIPIDARTLTFHFQSVCWPCTWDRVIRYGYLLWLLDYFFISNVRNEEQVPPKVKDLVFDVLQSTSALGAAIFLGFIVQDPVGGEFPIRGG